MILSAFKKYSEDFGISKKPCHPVSIPTAWNYGKHRTIAYYVEFMFWNTTKWNKWFFSEEDIRSYVDKNNLQHFVRTKTVVEVELP